MGRAERSHEARARDTHNLGRLLDIRHALRNSEWVETNIARARETVGVVKGVRDHRRHTQTQHAHTVSAAADARDGPRGTPGAHDEHPADNGHL